MGTTSSINAGLASLLQNLSSVGLPLLSSPKVMAALQKASPGDIVQLSAEAVELQGLNELLGQSDGSGDVPPSNFDPLLMDLYQPGGSTTSPDPLTALEQALTDGTTPGTAG